MNAYPADAGFRELIRPYTGTITDAVPAQGFSSDITIVVEGHRGSFFVKAVRNRGGGRLDSLLREESVNPYVRDVSPAIRWRVEDERWAVLGFDAVEGRPADFAPGSADLPTVIEAMNRIAAIPLPEVALGWDEERWPRYAAKADAQAFRGDRLLHTDIAPSNILIGTDNQAWVVDWSWPTRGAGFIDPGTLALQLIASGHTPESAESWVAGCTAWAEADPRCLSVFSHAALRMYQFRSRRKPDEQWLKDMVGAAGEWVTYRYEQRRDGLRREA